jgi:hypothetical protein
MVENCPLDRTSIIPIKRAHNFCTKYVEISTLSTDAIQPLAKLKDVKVQERVVAALKIMIDAGKKPTRRDVVTCIRNERPVRQLTWETKIRQNKKKIVEYQGRIRALERENEELRKCIQREYGIHQEPTPAVPDVVTDTSSSDNTPDPQFFGVKAKPKNEGQPKVIGLPAQGEVC